MEPARHQRQETFVGRPSARGVDSGMDGTERPRQTGGRRTVGRQVDSRVPRQQETPRDAVINKPRKGQCGERVWPRETEAQTDRKLAVIGLGR
jgi:hypothetical protein